MKKVILLLVLFAFSFSTKAQEKSVKYSQKVATLDSTIQTLYAVISGEKDEERDWDLFKYLFMQNAKLIPTSKNEEGFFVARYMSPSDYINTSKSWLVENGFFEKEIHRTVNTFGSITQVFSTYEAYQSETDTKPLLRGINSIQLLYDGVRWWVVNVFWTQETPESPIPQEYLPRD
ncbi:hypothetical protein [Bizionia arctica]|uniref:Nuclear transport factor 2 family protein n=1 Tax=Bizionia arctica TaxID=1495645 RepID=A0A917LML2_9FLAO|nr:hypothetical protein [Bizionia arctica]GGG43144.1 hypothetical protein GCM10010976_13300 [Bizionia arctica]